MAGRSLRPAEEVVEGPYDLQPLVAPVMTGWPARAFVRILESPLGSLVLPKLKSKSGFPQVLQDIHLPDSPAFSATWPSPPANINPASSGPEEFSFSQPSAIERACAAEFVIADGGRSERSIANGRPQIADYQAAYTKGTTTPSAVAENILRAIAASESHNPPLKLLRTYDAADLLRQAAESTKRYQQGSPRSCLEGIPFTVKDLTDALPYPTSGGSLYMADRRPVKADSPFVAALKEAGAMLVGKSATTEFGVSPLGYNANHGTPRNPHNTAHLTGGSSSGSAGIIACGICPISTGSDGGGSIRIPSSFCGLVGLLPTQARRPAVGGGVSHSTLASPGPMGICVADVALMYAVTANTGALDASIPAARVPRTLQSGLSGSRSLTGKTIGIFEPWFQDAQADIVSACKVAVSKLEQEGAKVTNIVLPELNMARIAHSATFSCEHAQNRKAEMRAGLRSRLNPDTRVISVVGQSITASDFIQAQSIRRRLMTHLTHAFKSCDMIASPTTPVTAPVNKVAASGRRSESPISDVPMVGKVMQYVTPANFAGLPAISVPVGMDSNGLPIGFQLMGPAWSESDLLAAAAVVEAAFTGANRLPDICYNVLSCT
ncbi:hypothetical protein WJX73_004387 [Symbiochloris irregularis]|uniref:Amidase domain-containing protein n=1 Tax=Symbiochloris irregularis TaxID=706552 RepID=A0AAW1Q0D3_9CHLO